ncbi:hypothetical protein S83_054948, partial [Arachis hypogaea]
IEVPKLERIELSMLEINHIWSDQIWSTFHTINQSNYPLQKLKELGKKYHTIKQTYSPFQNLIHLDVNGCWNFLKCLWSFSIARHLVNLQSLFVTDCNMTYIFPQDQGGGEAKTKKSNLMCSSTRAVLNLLLFSAILKSLTCAAVAISTCAAGSAAAVIPLLCLALPESSLVIVAARWLSSARQCLTSSLLCLSCLRCNHVSVRVTAEAFRVADAPAKVFFLLMENTEEILPFCTQIFQFQAQ